jgi:hypothetical protein
LVRLVVRDDPAQVHAAEEFIAGGAWVSHLVLAETAWVLDAVYKRTAQQIGTAEDMLLLNCSTTRSLPFLREAFYAITFPEQRLETIRVLGFTCNVR